MTMKPDPSNLWQIAVVTSPEAEEAVMALMEHVTGESAVTCSNPDTETITVSSYVQAEQRPDSRKRELETGLNHLNELGIEARPSEVTVEKVRSLDWAESWKKHFQPFSIQGRLLIKPSWSERAPQASETTVILDPGLSFGTGQHPTTRFCLDQIVTWHNPDEPPSLLDIGTGSGLLAIAAAKLGYSPIEAFDQDPDAIRTAIANAQVNKVDTQIGFACQDVEALPEKEVPQYTVVCANLFQPILLKASNRLLQRVRPDGLLVLAGILESQFEELEHHYAEQGWKLVATRVEDEWQSASFRCLSALTKE